MGKYSDASKYFSTPLRVAVRGENLNTIMSFLSTLSLDCVNEVKSEVMTTPASITYFFYLDFTLEHTDVDEHGELMEVPATNISRVLATQLSELMDDNDIIYLPTHEDNSFLAAVFSADAEIDPAFGVAGWGYAKKGWLNG
jgi:hypothetical protein